MRFSIYTEIQQHRADARAAVRRGARADGQRGPARLRHVRGDRALLLPEVLDLEQPDCPVRGRRAEDAEHHVPHDAARPAVPQPARAGLRDRRHRHPHRRALRVRRRARSRLDPDEGRRAARRGGTPALRGGRRSALQGARRGALLAPRHAFRRRRLAHPPVPAAEVPHLPRRHLRPHLRAGGAERLGRRGAPAAPLRRAARATRPLPRRVREARDDSRHRLDPRLPSRSRPRRRPCARHASGCSDSSRATPPR